MNLYSCRLWRNLATGTVTYEERRAEVQVFGRRSMNLWRQLYLVPGPVCNNTAVLLHIHHWICYTCFTSAANTSCSSDYNTSHCILKCDNIELMHKFVPFYYVFKWAFIFNSPHLCRRFKYSNVDLYTTINFGFMTWKEIPY